VSARPSATRLGRGIAALIDPEQKEPSGDASADGIRSIPIEMLEPGSHQPRGPTAAGSLDELADSIRAQGVLQPLLARPHGSTPDRFEIIAGERRWRAAQLAGLHEIPVLVRALSDADAMAAALVENLQRQDLNPIEEAEGYRRLSQEFGLTQEELAMAVGKSRSHVANTMRLLNLPSTVQGELRMGALTAGHARALLSHPEPAKAALAVISRGLNVRQTEALTAEAASRAMPGSRAAEGKTRDPDILALESDLTERLGLQVRIAGDGRRGTVSIRFDSLDQLDAILARLNS
jgi:ParB family chromosome partitioning protein